MNETINNQFNNSSDEKLLKELIQKMGEWLSYLKSQWLKIGIVGIICGVVGFLYAWIQPITYTAKITFVVEEGKSGGSSLGGLASLAGQLGVDVGGASGGGVMSGDNILLYFKSESLAREVLLSKYDNRSDKSVADVYADVYNLKNGWEKNEKIGKIDFPFLDSSYKYSRLQDSLLQGIINTINKKQFTITRTEKKASFIEVSTLMENEALAKIYCERIVERAVERYINIKTQRQKSTVNKLQIRVDSIANLLQKKTVSGASLQTSSYAMDINPLYRASNLVATETTVRDKTMLATIFSSVTQNLEIAKFTLSQETPVIQVVDSARFPLKKNATSKFKFGILFSLAGFFIQILYLTIKDFIKNIIQFKDK